MDNTEYEARIDAVLWRFGGSFQKPSGWLENGLAFSCGNSVITVPHATALDEKGRRAVVLKLEAQYANI